MANSGAQERRRSRTGRLRTPNVQRLYRNQKPEVLLGRNEFRIWLLRPDAGNIRIDGITESIGWRWEPGDPVLRGELSLKKPDRDIQPVNIHDGHVLKLDVKWAGHWRELWRMRLYNGQLGWGSRDWDFELADDMVMLQESKDDWHFTKTKKKKPHGWYCHEIVREVARRYRIPLGKIAKGTKRITNLSMQDASPLQVIQKAYAIEREHSGKRFVLQWRDGKLNVMPLRRNPIMYVLRDQIVDALLGKEPRDERFATAVTVRATVKDGKRKRRKVSKLVVNEGAVKKEGFIHRRISGGTVESLEDAERKGKRYIAKHSVRKRTITGIQHPGIPFIRRGDACRVSIPEEGYKGEHGIAFVTSGSWQLAGGTFNMTLDMGFDDPYKSTRDRRREKDKKTRDQKRARRG